MAIVMYYLCLLLLWSLGPAFPPPPNSSARGTASYISREAPRSRCLPPSFLPSPVLSPRLPYTNSEKPVKMGADDDASTSILRSCLRATGPVSGPSLTGNLPETYRYNETPVYTASNGCPVCIGLGSTASEAATDWECRCSTRNPPSESVATVLCSCRIST
jgi:hypothetical protein